MSATAFRLVRKTVATNPVARAVAKKRIQAAINDMLIECYGYTDGTQDLGAYVTVRQCVMVATYCATKMMLGDDVIESMSKALQVCDAGIERGGLWIAADCAAIDCGLGLAGEIVSAAPAQIVNEASFWVINGAAGA